MKSQKQKESPRLRARISGRPSKLWIVLTVVTVVVVAGALYFWSVYGAQPPIDRFIDLQQYRYGVPPQQEFEFDATGPNGPVLSAGQPMWRTYVDLYAPSPEFVLLQASALAERRHYPLAILKDVSAADITFGGYVKVLGGSMDQSAGLLWRYQDKDNYYAALANGIDHKIHLVAIKRGQAIEIAASPAVPFDAEFERSEPSATHGWYNLGVVTLGRRIAVWFGDQKVIDVADATFTRAGQVGVLTHADTVAVFDDLHIQAGRLRVTSTPRPTYTPVLPPIMHVADIFTTEATFQTPQPSFTRGGQVFWKIIVLDKNNLPVPAAPVKVEVVRPDGSVLATPQVATGSDGSVLFIQNIGAAEPAGIYTLRVVDITNQDFQDATYDPVANVKTSTTFEVK
jgi:hypothetical protein